MSAFSEDPLYGSTAELLAKIGIHNLLKLEPLPGGRNNRVYRVDTSEGHFFLKSYFSPPHDPRDRLRHEYGFTSFVWSCGIRSVPQPLGSLPVQRLALYEFVHGKPASHRATTTDDVQQAIGFMQSVHSHRRSHQTRDLPPASEACFSLEEHLENTKLRVERLSFLEMSDDYDRSAGKQVQKELMPLWGETQDRILSAVRRDPHNGRVLSLEERWISPSDFGFHNAIEEKDGRMRFIDFEYAGWDDPAKLLCDFANQPDRILDPEISGRFTDAIIASDVRPEFLRFRYGLLEPLYQIKWACIILNDFLPSGETRRAFTLTNDVASRKRSQLTKLDVMLERAKKSLSSSFYPT